MNKFLKGMQFLVWVVFCCGAIAGFSAWASEKGNSYVPSLSREGIVKLVLYKASRNDLSEEVAVEAFLLGSEFYYEADYENALKLFEVAFLSSSSLPAGIYLMSTQNALKRVEEANRLLAKLRILYPYEKFSIDFDK